MKRPLVHVALAFAIGIVVARFYSPPVPALVLVFLFVLGTLIAKLHWNLGGSRIRPLAWGLMAAGLLGAIRYTWEHERLFRHTESVYQISRWGPTAISGTVEVPPVVRGEWARMIVRDLEVRVGGRSYQLEIKALAMLHHDPEGGSGISPQIPDLRPGDRISFQGRLDEIREASLPGAFDMRELMAAEGVFARVLVWKPDQMVVKRGRLGLGDRFRRLCFDLRARINAHLDATMPSAERGLFRAMMLGERTGFPRPLWDAMTRSGLSHLTVVSGLHFSILIGLFAGFLKLLGVRRRWAALLAIPFIFVLLGITGYRLPTIRAAIMGMILIGAVLLQREADSLNDLGLAMLVLLLISPLHLFRVGFQLSFLAVAGIILLTRRIHVWTEGGHWLWNWVITGLGSSAGAFLGTAPAVAYHFGVFTPIAVLANLWAIPLATVILGLGLVGSVLGLLFSGFVGPLMALNAHLLRVLGGSAQLFAGLPGAWFQYPRPALWWVAAAYLVLLLLVVPGNVLPARWGKVRLRRHHFVLGWGTVILWVGGLLPTRGQLAVNFLNVGQGDAIFVEFPGRGTMLVDGGPPELAGQLAGFLRSRGLRRIDLVVVTHPQADHIGGIPTVLANFEVGLVVDSGIPGEEEAYEECERLIRERKIPRAAVSRGDTIAGCGETEILVLHPPPVSEGSLQHLQEGSRWVNEYSVVLFIGYGRVGVLLTGDIGHSTEEALYREYGDLDCTVLKVPHHGSRYSSSQLLVNLTDPEVAVIEVGANPHGHPSREVVERYGEYGALVFRTDWDGTVRFLTDGDEYRIEAARRREIHVGELAGGTGN